MKIYRGVRQASSATAYADDCAMDAGPSRRIKDYAPDFEWGYGGAGPSQLALAILLDHTGNPTMAMQFHREFVYDFIFPAEYDGFTIMGSMIQAWIERQAPQDA